MTVTLDDPASGKSLTLWNAAEDNPEVQVPVQADSVRTFTSDETILTALEKHERVTLSGTATGMRLISEPEFSDDPLTALAEWVAKAESMHDTKQGSGYELSVGVRDDTTKGAITTLDWRRNAGEKYEVSWDLNFRVGRTAMGTGATAPDSVSPRTTWSLGGTDLGKMRALSHTLEMEVQPFAIAFADSAEENPSLVQSGVTRRVTINAEVVGTRAERNSFDADIRSMQGTDLTYPFKSAFPGREIEVAVEKYSPRREAGRTRIHEYDLTLIEGITLVN